MSRKSLDDFDGDYQAYADYLESGECMNDDGIDVYADEKGNIYTPTEGDWTKGHGHDSIDDPRPGRDSEEPKSYGRKRYNRWLKYSNKIVISQEEAELLDSEFKREKELKLKINK